MRCVWLVLAVGLCSLACAQRWNRPPPPPPFGPAPPAPFAPSPPRRHIDNDSFQFPAESDIVFPNSDQTSEESIENMKYKINDYLPNNQRGNKPKRPKNPSRRQRPAYKPGEPFPPPPNGRRNKKPKNKRRDRRRLCERKYSEYIERIFPNDTAVAEDAIDEEFDGRVLAKPGEYPHMAALGFQQQNSEKIAYKCGGSLISENFVLSAAHCTDDEGVAPTWVRIGGLNLMIDDGATGTSQIIGIESFENFPEYRSDQYYHDIALLKLQRNVMLTEFVRPIKLWVNEEIPTSIAFAMGYGSTSLGKTMTNRLTHLNVSIVPNDECNRDLPAFEETPNGIIASQICAQDFVLSRDTCQGDSGGPLQLNLPGRRRRRHIHYHLIGITSYGVFCRSSFPSVYTRVLTYLDWIEQLVWAQNN